VFGKGYLVPKWSKLGRCTLYPERGVKNRRTVCNVTGKGKLSEKNTGKRCYENVVKKIGELVVRRHKDEGRVSISDDCGKRRFAISKIGRTHRRGFFLKDKAPRGKDTRPIKGVQHHTKDGKRKKRDRDVE